jgi:hypothetical protein
MRVSIQNVKETEIRNFPPVGEMAKVNINSNKNGLFVPMYPVTSDFLRCASDIVDSNYDEANILFCCSKNLIGIFAE